MGFMFLAAEIRLAIYADLLQRNHPIDFQEEFYTRDVEGDKLFLSSRVEAVVL